MLAVAVFALAKFAAACPNCATAAAARTLFWRADLSYLLAAVALKFLILLVVARRLDGLDEHALHASSEQAGGS